jgi:phage host-nuclease inhibitor protein Gam
MTERIRLRGPVIESRAEMEILVAEITELKLRLKQSANAMDEALTGVRERYEKRQAGLEKSIAEKSTVAQAWAEANWAEFGSLKSLEFTHGTVGWRSGQPQLRTLSGWTWDRVLEKLKQEADLSGYVRAREEVNKQMILGDRERLGNDGLRGLGVRVVQEESFFIEPKLSIVENRVSKTAL